VDLGLYPTSERINGRDGWVMLNLMVDPRGKPYEIAVTDSSGNKVLEQAALEAAKNWEFEPATLNGTPIDACTRVKARFVITGESGASASFVTAYREFIGAIGSQDRSAADQAMAKLKARNLYEDAFYGLAQYQYARLWGTENQQYVALRRAIAGENDANYLPKKLFNAALEDLMRLQIRHNDFADVLETWGKLEKVANAETRARWQEPIGRIEALRTDHAAFSVAGDFASSEQWGVRLFRNRFYMEVGAGRVSEIKLRCDRKYVSFRYEPGLEYTIAEKYGACSLQLLGDPGTKVTLTQL
jgi:TonB family protein